MQADIGEAAGTIYRVLYHNGPVSLEWMCMVSGLPAGAAHRGIGWLAREGKLHLERKRRGRELRVRKAVAHLWQFLRLRGPMSAERIRDMAGLPADMAHQGLGWLAREGRLAVAGSGGGGGGELQIGEVAGSIWRALHSQGPMSKQEAREATGLPENLVDQGIGWLVREGKLVLEDRRKGRGLPFQEEARSVWQVTHSNWPVFKRRLYQALGLPLETGGRKGARPAPNGILSLEQGGTGQQVRVEGAAGAIWDALHRRGLVFRRDLGAATGFSEGTVDQGIGWLAREEKLVLGLDRKGHEWLRLKG